MNPEVSVIIPTYNSEQYLAQALTSVLNQTHQHIEVILVDDASIDSSVSIAQGFADSRLKIIKNSYNQGVSYSRNCAIKAAQGTWIALLDSDDWYAHQRLAKLLTLAEAKNADLVADDLWLVNDAEAIPWSSLLQESSYDASSLISVIDGVKLVTSDRLLPIDAKRTWSLGYTKPLIRKDFLLENNIFYDETINVGEDFVLYLECLRQQAKFYLLAQPYYYYRTRATSLSARKPTAYLSQSCEITTRFVNREVRSSEESRLLQALLQNLIIFQKRLEYYRFVEQIKEKNLLAGVKHVITHPYILTDLSRKLMVILKDRFSSWNKSNYQSQQTVTQSRIDIYTNCQGERKWLPTSSEENNNHGKLAKSVNDQGQL